jgi:uncharacterized protein involved in outer membrane biogenesis
MLKKILIGVAVLLVVASAGLFFWARAVFGQDTVRNALAAQIGQAIGQPVTIGSVGATIYPRVTVKLGDVSIGQPARVTVRTLDVGTDFGALLSRKIEHAAMHMNGARIELPLPDFTVGSSPAETDTASPVEIVSIDEVVLSDVEIVSGGRTLRGDIEVVPQGTSGLTIRRIALGAGDATVDITGKITDFAGPSGDVAVKAGALDFDELLAFASDFAGGAGTTTAAGAAPAVTPATSAPGPAAAASTMDLALTLDADRATMGGLTIEKLSGRARLTPTGMTLEPIGFGLFGGRYDGTLALTLGATPDFRLKAQLSGVDMAAATAFAGSPNMVTGKLSGSIDLSGSGMEAPAVVKTARGTARVDITDGTVKNLGLVRTIVIATGGGGVKGQGGSSDEPFSRLGGTLAIAGGAASTNDLKFESRDLLLSAAGTVGLDGSSINLKGQVQLSEELTKQAGSDLVRYTQDQGKVTLPATITGSAENPQVRIDVASMAKRAITNRATEEAQKQLKGRLGGLFGR